MKPEAQRIAIAEACGWTNLRQERHRELIVGVPDHFLAGEPPEGVIMLYPTSPPDYLGDLNAMHEAEIRLIYAEGKGMVS